MSIKDKIILYQLLHELDKEATQLLTSDDLHELGMATSICRSIITIESYLRKDMP